MRDWLLTDEGYGWSVKLDVRDLGGHLDATFRGWSATGFSCSVGCSRLVLIFCPPVGFPMEDLGSFGPCVFRVFFMVWACLACASCVPLCSGLSGLVDSHWQTLVRCLACVMVPSRVILRSVLFGSGGISLIALLRSTEFIICWIW